MIGMHPYIFEQLHQARQAELQRRHVHTWLLTDLMKKNREDGRLSVFSRGKKYDALQSKAFLVLEEMLQHENEELRLRAAEIILHRSRSTLFPRILRRS